MLWMDIHARHHWVGSMGDHPACTHPSSSERLRSVVLQNVTNKKINNNNKKMHLVWVNGCIFLFGGIPQNRGAFLLLSLQHHQPHAHTHTNKIIIVGFSRCFSSKNPTQNDKTVPQPKRRAAPRLVWKKCKMRRGTARTPQEKHAAQRRGGHKTKSAYWMYIYIYMDVYVYYYYGCRVCGTFLGVEGPRVN